MVKAIACLTDSSGIIAGKVKSLALVAPAPITLPGDIAGILNERIVSTIGVIVSGARRADSRRVVSGEVHALALVTPPPVALVVVHAPHRPRLLKIVRKTLQDPEAH